MILFDFKGDLKHFKGGNQILTEFKVTHLSFTVVTCLESSGLKEKLSIVRYLLWSFAQ